eukprot:9432252-Pyramimonas_sp.AAC.1
MQSRSSFFIVSRTPPSPTLFLVFSRPGPQVLGHPWPSAPLPLSSRSHAPRHAVRSGDSEQLRV